jgi:Pyruvate/2-oxoglutarate dehydrogenase complex, dihydrolipoamide dehydrogenase (E3) component, and related enzymes
MKEFDVIVIGSGSGLEVASAYTSRGKQVAIVEPGRLGGTCLNRGCIPSKMLIHSADIVENIEDAENFHINAEIKNIDFPKITSEVNQKIKEESKAIEKSLQSSENHTLYKEEAKFTDEKTLKVGNKQITADKIIIAAGSRPLIPPIEGIEKVDYLTSKDALKLEECPDEL